MEFCVALASGDGVAMARGKAIDGGELHVTKVAGGRRGKICALDKIMRHEWDHEGLM